MHQDPHSHSTHQLGNDRNIFHVQYDRMIGNNRYIIHTFHPFDTYGISIQYHYVEIDTGKLVEALEFLFRSRTMQDFSETLLVDIAEERVNDSSDCQYQQQHPKEKKLFINRTRKEYFSDSNLPFRNILLKYLRKKYL